MLPAFELLFQILKGFTHDGYLSGHRRFIDTSAFELFQTDSMFFRLTLKTG